MLLLALRNQWLMKNSHLETNQHIIIPVISFPTNNRLSPEFTLYSEYYSLELLSLDRAGNPYSYLRCQSRFCHLKFSCEWQNCIPVEIWKDIDKYSLRKFYPCTSCMCFHVHTMWASKVGTKMSWLPYLSLPSFVPSFEEAEDSGSRRVYMCSWRLYIHRPWLSGDWEVLLCHFSWFPPWSCKFSCIINTRVASTFLYFLGGKGLTCPRVWM